MRSINRRLSKLEARFAPIVEPDDDGSAHKELLRRIEAIRARMRPEDLLPESGPLVEAQTELILKGLREIIQNETFQGNYR